jgi:nickel/cobalt transporter (NiCoT) family protein
MGQLPVTCGLYFSLGHSTIVIVVTVAIAISTDIYDKLGNVGRVGGIVGAAISGSFLFIVGVANSIILYRIVRQRRSVRIELHRLLLVTRRHPVAIKADLTTTGTLCS